MLAPAVALTAVLGDQCAYFIGRRIGPALFDKEDSRFFKKSYVTQSHAFFEKYGPNTIILARFVPIVRTFTPVLAGVPYMRYPVFLGFDIIGGVAWGGGLTLLGYFLGSRVPFVNEHLEVVILLIVFLSILPGVISVGRALLERRRSRGVSPEPVGSSSPRRHCSVRAACTTDPRALRRAAPDPSANAQAGEDRSTAAPPPSTRPTDGSRAARRAG